MMGFPAHVPAAVREYITTLVEGDSREPQGWAASLAGAEERLAKIEMKILEWTQHIAGLDASDIPESLHDKLAELRKQRA